MIRHRMDQLNQLQGIRLLSQLHEHDIQPRHVIWGYMTV
jgi:hypothetical protein